LPCNAPGTPVRVPVRTELEQTEESGEDVSAHADLHDADICPTCTQAIVEAAVDTEGQEAILCEGSCNCWYHRWCAGVSTLRYKALSMSMFAPKPKLLFQNNYLHVLELHDYPSHSNSKNAVEQWLYNTE